jgi:hypothetical protein
MNQGKGEHLRTHEFRTCFLPCILFHTLHLPFCLCSFIARVQSDVKADQKCKKVLFDDGALSQFYLAEHKRAVPEQKHIHLSNSNVLFEMLPDGVDEPSSPASKGAPSPIL